MTALEHIRAKYPDAIKELPKGWRFLEFKEKITKNDKYWNISYESFERVVVNVGMEYDSTFKPMIRRDRKKKIFDCLPGLTWPAAVKKEGEVRDMVYIGQGRVGGINGIDKGEAFSFSLFGERKGSSKSYNGASNFYHYFVPKDHPMLAKYALPKEKTKAELTAENTALLAENKALKERIAKFEKSAKELAGI